MAGPPSGQPLLGWQVKPCHAGMAGGAKVNRSLITGITGQDGSYLAELLLQKRPRGTVVIRRSSTFSTSGIDHIYVDPHEPGAKLFLRYGGLSDSTLCTKPCSASNQTGNREDAQTQEERGRYPASKQRRISEAGCAPKHLPLFFRGEHVRTLAGLSQTGSP